ncbi:MAG: metalloprotease TldD [Bauldia sp.]|nr:metalloprotease TldD [Bauldia sp.]
MSLRPGLAARIGLDADALTRLVADATHGCEDGELFVESRAAENLVFDQGRLKTANYREEDGFGLRAVSGPAVVYASAGDLSEAALRRAAETAKGARLGRSAHAAEPPRGTNRRPYPDADPVARPGFADKAALLGSIDAYARAKDPRVQQVSIQLDTVTQSVAVVRPDAAPVDDLRPLVKLSITVFARDGERQEIGSYGFGARKHFAEIVSPDAWRAAADEAVRLALVLLDARAAPAGEMSVVLGPGWPGILLHEAVGHGLEGDAHRKGTSAFAGLMGKRVAAPGVTVLDDGTLDTMRGSLAVDDEGTPTSRTVLIEDGILVGLMQDRQNARLMGGRSTGNGRRQSYANVPMPRMTNTFMLGGEHDPREILASVKDGLFAVSFGGGQVDITSGKFVFTCTEAYRIENGRIGAPVKGAVLIGNGPDALTRVRMIGNDMALDPGIGMCGKFGQLVPVGVGQPTLLVDGLTVGGTG